ncbi:MAG: hypothetical protein DRJ47_00465 [Thermoprotei archaeon]|nr:MAG: hypothetical protein DRJ47_00465 [Thermoprotei archaeon]
MSVVGLDRERYVLVDFYPVKPPYAYAGIYMDKFEGRLKYIAIEPVLRDVDRRVLKIVERLLLEDRSIDLKVLLEKKDVEDFLKRRVDWILKKRRIRLEDEAVEKIKYYVLRDLLGYGRVDVLIRDPDIEDISCDGVGVPVYVWHRRYESLATNIVFEDVEELNSFIIKLAYRAGKQISVASPIVEGSIPEGYRIHLTLKEVSRRGGTFTIRKFSEVPYTVIDLIGFGTFSIELAAYLWYLIDAKKSLMIGGATAAGKTTALNSLAVFIRPEAKIVTIEETPELRLPHENWIPLVARPGRGEWIENITLFDLLKSALRMRPDYIIVGEVRGEEAYTLFQSIATGHAGMCTIHAENVDYAIKRLETEPMNIPRLLIPMMNVYIQMERVKIGEKIARRAIDTYEIVGLNPETEEVILNRVFRWNPTIDKIEHEGESELLKQIARTKFLSMKDIYAEIENRRRIIEYLLEKGMSSFHEVSRVIRDYYGNPDEVLYRIEAGAL